MFCAGAARSNGCSAEGSAQCTPRASERRSIDEQTAREEQALLVCQAAAVYKEQPWYCDRQVCAFHMPYTPFWLPQSLFEAQNVLSMMSEHIDSNAWVSYHRPSGS